MKNNSFLTGKITTPVLCGLLYTFAAYVSLQLSTELTHASPLWPAAGFALASTLVFGNRIIPAIAAGSFAANFIFFLGKQPDNLSNIIFFSLMASAAAAGEAIIISSVLKKLNADKVLEGTKNFSLFFVTVIATCIITSVTGAYAFYLFQNIPATEFGATWFTWFEGDVSGLLVLTPALLAWRKRDFIPSTNNHVVTILLFGLLAIALFELFDVWTLLNVGYYRIYGIFVLLIFCGIYLDIRLSSLTVLLVSAIATWSTLSGRGVFYAGNNSYAEAMTALQIFLCVASVMIMFLAAATYERKSAESKLKEINNSLEEKIQTRTKEIRKQEAFLTESNRQLLQKTKELERSNKEFQSFAHIASHDMQEPLRTISSYIQILEHRYKDTLDSEGKELMNYTIDGARRMQALIKDLLAYSSVESKGKDFEEIDLHVVIDIVKKNLHNAIVTREAEIICEDEFPVVLADSFQLIQLFQNIIDNAIKYCPEKKPVIRISVSENEKGWMVCVSDNGIGIEEKYLDRIFNIFQRLHTREKYSGTGIGLAICRKIAERHSGKIWAESVAGKGTTFYFTIETKSKMKQELMIVVKSEEEAVTA